MRSRPLPYLARWGQSRTFVQHNDRAKRDRHQGPKASVNIAGDAIQLVARTRGHARQSSTFVQHSGRAKRDAAQRSREA